MKVISRLAVVTIVAGFVLALSASAPVHAFCATGGFTISASGPPYHYITLADGSPPNTAELTGRFWLIGRKGTHHNGGYTTSSSPGWVTGNPPYVNGDWGADTAIVGCPNPAEGGPPPAEQPARTVVHLIGRSGLEWGLSCIQAQGDGAAQRWDYAPLWTAGTSGTDFQLAEVAPKVQSSVSGPGTVSVTLRPITLAFYADSGDGPCSTLKSNTQASVQIHSQCVAAGSPAPTAALPGGWTSVQNPQAPGTPIPFVCATAQECYLLSSASVDGEVVAGAVSNPIECNSNLAGRPGIQTGDEFRIIKKPTRRR